MNRITLIVLMGSVLTACSAKAPVTNASMFVHHHPHPQLTGDKEWIDPPEVGAAPGAPRPAGLD